MFDINIVCDKKGGYKYYIENAEDMEKGGVRTWLLNTFAVNNLINESHHLKRRIMFEQIPSGQKFLTPIIEAMRDGLSVEITYKSFDLRVYGTQKEYFRTLPLHHSQEEVGRKKITPCSATTSHRHPILCKRSFPMGVKSKCCLPNILGMKSENMPRLLSARTDPDFLHCIRLPRIFATFFY